MIDNSGKSRFELTENGLLAFARYDIENGVRVLTHVEADEGLRGTGAAGRLMAAIVAAARAGGFRLRPVCPYAKAWLARHADAHDVLAPP